jgi:hypothetical protein
MPPLSCIDAWCAFARKPQPLSPIKPPVAGNMFNLEAYAPRIVEKATHEQQEQEG